jgi:hypothetical protein
LPSLSKTATKLPSPTSSTATSPGTALPVT